MDEKPIRRFKDKFKFLSLKSPHTATYNNIHYPSAEAAFQAATNDYMETGEFNLHTPKFFKRESLRTPEDIKKRVMYDILYSKFSMNIDAKNVLLYSETRPIINGNKTESDLYWGFNLSSWSGANELGKQLENVRFIIRYSKAKGSCSRCPAYVSCNNSCDCMLRLYYGEEEFKKNLERSREIALSNNFYNCLMRTDVWKVLTKDFRTLFFEKYPHYFNPNRIWINFDDLE